MGDADLSSRMTRAPDEAAIIALAARAGYECEVEDLQAVLLAAAGAGSELSEDALGSVAGGGMYSWPKVSNTPVPPFGSVPIPYP